MVAVKLFEFEEFEARFSCDSDERSSVIHDRQRDDVKLRILDERSAISSGMEILFVHVIGIVEINNGFPGSADAKFVKAVLTAFAGMNSNEIITGGIIERS